MRTTTWQIIKLAFALWRHPHRKHLRIGQILVNANTRARIDTFYVENDAMLENIKEFERFWLEQTR